MTQVHKWVDGCDHDCSKYPRGGKPVKLSGLTPVAFGADDGWIGVPGAIAVRREHLESAMDGLDTVLHYGALSISGINAHGNFVILGRTV